MANILVTGGAGYIGSATAKRLAAAGHAVTVYDNLSTGHADLVRFGPLVEADIRDTARMTAALAGVDGVVHFAASAYVGESVTDPGRYYDNNVGGTLSLLNAMRAAGVGALVVSSTCAVYGQPERMPIREDAAKAPINPYGMTKLVMERMCADFEAAHGIRTVALRYFNACGCEPELEVGERHDPETHLIPRILMAACGEIPAFQLFGDDYPTADGTCVRDYVHVWDLAEAHARALERLLAGGPSDAVNLGTGRGTSVRAVLDAAARATGRAIPVAVQPRRPGDPAELVADPAHARAALGFAPALSDMDTIVDTAWRWHRKQRGG
ncbi:MAG: UDP-glucose 4-epimerase GalE [Alphaproteobacteria bacterium]